MFAPDNNPVSSLEISNFQFSRFIVVDWSLIHGDLLSIKSIEDLKSENKQGSDDHLVKTLNRPPLATLASGFILQRFLFLTTYLHKVSCIKYEFANSKKKKKKKKKKNSTRCGRSCKSD